MSRGSPRLPRVVAGYPVRALRVAFGGTRVRLLVVARLEDHVDAVALLRDPEVPEPPYWAHLWPGSRVLARVLATQVDCTGRRVLDIGCGLGLAGVVAALRGGTVTVVDRVAEALHFARATAAVNGCRVDAVQSDLCGAGIRGRFDYCLAADVTYDPALQEGLAACLAAHLAPGGRGWCAESVRTAEAGFGHACARLGLEVRARDARALEDGRVVRVRLTEIGWPRTSPRRRV